MNRLSKVLEKIKSSTGIEVKLKVMDEIDREGESFFRDRDFSYFVFRMGEKYVYGYFPTTDGDETLARLFASMLEDAAKGDYEKLPLSEKFRLLFLGELTQAQQVELKASFPDGVEAYAVGFFTDSVLKQRELVEYLNLVERPGDNRIVVDDTCVMLYTLTGAGDEYKNAYDFARVTYENIKEELRINLTVCSAGDVRGFDDAARSYDRAMKAYEYGRRLNPGKNVYAYHFYATAYALEPLSKNELGALLDALSPYSSGKAWEDAELVGTGEEFVASSLNVSETSRLLYIHRNTLMYRLDKIEKETGLDIRSYADASVFELILTIKKLIATA